MATNFFLQVWVVGAIIITIITAFLLLLTLALEEQDRKITQRWWDRKD